MAEMQKWANFLPVLPERGPLLAVAAAVEAGLVVVVVFVDAVFLVGFI